jgi:hypothetical protein
MPKEPQKTFDMEAMNKMSPAKVKELPEMTLKQVSVIRKKFRMVTGKFKAI